MQQLLPLQQIPESCLQTGLTLFCADILRRVSASLRAPNWALVLTSLISAGLGGLNGAAGGVLNQVVNPLVGNPANNPSPGTPGTPPSTGSPGIGSFLQPASLPCTMQ